MELMDGYKKSDIGVIPKEWETSSMGEVINIKGGFAFSSNFFSDKEGVVLLTPGNFKLNGGLYFNERNIKRFKGAYSSNAIFSRGDLLIVMTDLTPDCNLLGKPAFVDSNEKILHNQRIGKVLTKVKISKDFLYWTMLSPLYLKQIKDKATGSTVRHTSNKSIYSAIFPLPPLPEQQAIAEVLTDTDNLIQALEKQITKKRLIKQGAMQQLLAPKKGWKEKRLGDVARITMGQSPSSTFYNQSGDGLPLIQGNADIQNRKIIIRNYSSQITKECKTGDIIMSVRAPVGEVAIATFEACIGRGVCALSYSNHFLYHFLIYKEPSWAKLSTGSTFDSINSDTLRNLSFFLPSEEEQINIANILTSVDDEIELLVNKKHKYQQLKQGLMQNLLTGKILLN